MIGVFRKLTVLFTFKDSLQIAALPPFSYAVFLSTTLAMPPKVHLWFVGLQQHANSILETITLFNIICVGNIHTCIYTNLSHSFIAFWIKKNHHTNYNGKLNAFLLQRSRITNGKRVSKESSWRVSIRQQFRTHKVSHRNKFVETFLIKSTRSRQSSLANFNEFWEIIETAALLSSIQQIPPETFNGDFSIRPHSFGLRGIIFACSLLLTLYLVCSEMP